MSCRSRVEKGVGYASQDFVVALTCLLSAADSVAGPVKLSMPPNGAAPRSSPHLNEAPTAQGTVFGNEAQYWKWEDTLLPTDSWSDDLTGHGRSGMVSAVDLPDHQGHVTVLLPPQATIGPASSFDGKFSTRHPRVIVHERKGSKADRCSGDCPTRFLSPLQRRCC